MYRRKLIQGVTMVNEGRVFKGSLLIENDHIERIFEGDNTPGDIQADAIIDAAGCYLLPGVIDEHVHFRDPGLTYKGDFVTESRAAAAGGVTTVFDMPNVIPQTTTKELLMQKLEMAARKSCINYAFFIGATADNISAIHQLNPRKVAGVKLFMGSSTGDMLVDDDSALRQLFATCRLPIMAHCEDSDIIRTNMQAYRATYGDDPEVCHHSAIRSTLACMMSTERAVALAREYDARLHVAHLSTAAELSLFLPGDTRVTAEVCLPHLLFCDDDYARLGARIKCNPSIKTSADRAALRSALADGVIATVGTDHAPHAISEKVGGAARALSGMPMVQFSLPAMLGLVDEGVLTLPRMVEVMCHAPARLFDVESRGFLREGYKADLVLVRPHAPWTLTPNRIISRCNWSPLEGRSFHWRVEKTYCNGYLVYSNGQITDDSFRGQAVTFNR